MEIKFDVKYKLDSDGEELKVELDGDIEGTIWYNLNKKNKKSQVSFDLTDMDISVGEKILAKIEKEIRTSLGNIAKCQKIFENLIVIRDDA